MVGVDQGVSILTPLLYLSYSQTVHLQSTVILLALLIPGSLLILFMFLCWFRLLSRQRIVQIIHQNRSPQTSTGGHAYIGSAGRHKHSKGYSRRGRHGGRGDLESGTISPVSGESEFTGAGVDDILAKESTTTSTTSSWKTSSESASVDEKGFHGHGSERGNAKVSRKTGHKKAKDRRWRWESGVHKEIGASYSKKSRKFRPRKDSVGNVESGNHKNSRGFGVSQEPPRISIGSLGADRFGPWYVPDQRHTGMLDTGHHNPAAGSIRNSTDRHQTGGSLAPRDSVQVVRPSSDRYNPVQVDMDLSIPREIPGTLGTLVIPLPDPPVAQGRQSVVRDSGLSRDFTFSASEPPIVPAAIVAAAPPDPQNHQEEFQGFGKAKDLKPLPKAKLRDSDESSVD